MSFDIDVFRDRILDGVAGLAENTVRDAVTQARKDTEVFFAETRAKFEFWGRALASGELNREEFELLVRARRSNMKMHALQAAGVTQNSLERFRTGLISLILDSAFDLV